MYLSLMLSDNRYSCYVSQNCSYSILVFVFLPPSQQAHNPTRMTNNTALNPGHDIHCISAALSKVQSHTLRSMNVVCHVYVETAWLCLLSSKPPKNAEAKDKQEERI